MDSNLYNGVRAEPKFLRDPTSLESISSGISRLSSYVTSNLQKRKSSMTSPFDPQYQQYQQQLLQQQQQQQQQLKDENSIAEEENDMEDVDTVTFAAFDKLEYRDSTSISCLLLGYGDGFQLWDITNPDNVHELCSIRDKELFGTVSYIHIVKQEDEKPLLAVVSETTVENKKENIPLNEIPTTAPPPQQQQHRRMDSNTSSSTTSSNTLKKSCNLIIYSLQTHTIVKEINDFGEEEDDTTVVTCIKSNHKIIVLGCLSRHKSSIHILSTKDFKPVVSPLTDVFHDSTTGPVFALGTRLIAYATNAAVLNSDPVMTSLTNKSISYTGFGVLQGEKDVKGAAKDIAKEVVSGMKTLGEFGYNTLSNYFGNNASSQPPPQSEKMYGSSPSNRRLSSHSPRSQQQLQGELFPSNSTSNSSSNKKMTPSGMIMIRDILKLPTAPTRNLSVSTVAHFRPHTHPVTCLTFNPAGTLLMSASKQGHTFHIFSILTNTSTSGNASHLYSLSRGITDAQVEDCQFSVDSTWCAISTARGTTHVYAINPYGGKPEIAGHMHGKVNNPAYYPFMSNKAKPKATTLSSVVRIKQRRKMPGTSNLSASGDDLGKYSVGPNANYGYYGPTPPHYIPTMPPIIPRTTNISKEPRAKITSMFVTATKSPYLVNNSSVYNKGTHASSSETSSNATTQSTVGTTIKQQATSMLSSFGSSMSNIPYLPSQPSQQQKTKWNDKSDTLMFGFDEEYDDSAKMINDEIGYQDLYSFHPDGILTLHRCWVAKTVVKKRENGRNIEKLDLSLKEEDVAEWRVARNADWDQVKLSMDPGKHPVSAADEEQDSNSPSTSPQQSTKKKNKKGLKTAPHELPTTDVYKPMNAKKLWLSNAEITTYALVPDDPALWTYHQFSFQTFQESKDTQRLLHAGIIPATDTLIMLKGMPEPVSSRIDRVRKTETRIANDNEEENIDDALAELEDNISKAMQTSFSPSSNSISNSPAAASLKWLSSSANAASVPSPSSVNTRSFLDKNSSVSFEDAYLIHMGSGPSPEPSMHNNNSSNTVNMMQHSSLIQFDDDDDKVVHEAEEDIIRLEDDDDIEHSIVQRDVYSPDGDNEVAYPSESVFGEIRDRSFQKKDSDDESNASW